MRERISYFPLRDGKLPQGARYVGRTSRWGNPFTVEDHGREKAVEAEISTCAYFGLHGFRCQAGALFRRYATARHSVEPEFLEPLRSASALGCACRLEDECHGDVLLELAREVA